MFKEVYGEGFGVILPPSKSKKHKKQNTKEKGVSVNPSAINKMNAKQNPINI